MELSKNYNPSVTEEKWYEHWLQKQYFYSKPNQQKPFTIVIPPPNVTGVLHMGHTLNETVQDILARRARMSGLNVCWVPGSDHASIATEAKVVQMLKEQGIDKQQLSREAFLKYAFEWKEKYGNIIYKQIAKLGCSVDWKRVTFTMDEHYYQAVIRSFVQLYNDNLIYRGARMIHWDPQAKTALSDEEVEYKDVQGCLYYIKYFLENSNEYIVVATQRPETIMGDVAVCAHPSDARYTPLKGKQVIVPLINKKVPVIYDEYVDAAFGTGILKITPAHDIHDYEIGLKHHLPAINVLNDDGTISAVAGIYVGEDRFEARKKIVAELKEKGLIVKQEDYNTRLGFSQRTQAVVEPRISTQWFVKMEALAKPALNEVLKGNVQIHPEDKFISTYKYWLENVKDWCISRQLWWGQRIPAWYAPDGSFEVAETVEEAYKNFQNKEGFSYSIEQLKQDEDVLDTWFSSWLWPIEVFYGITQPNNEDFKYYYPTSVLVTGQDIIFFWVARMIMAGLYFKKQKPFHHVYFTGMVRDKLGRKMSKSLGNSPDLLELIERYGADAVRFGIMIAAPAGNDLLFDEASLEQGRNFNNKIWNALRLIKSWELKTADTPCLPHETFAAQWFANRLQQIKAQQLHLFEQFKLSEALKDLYSLFWDEFCSVYLEWIKPEPKRSMNKELLQQTQYFFEQLLQLLHPYMPFITEEVYHLIKNREDDLCVKPLLPSEPYNAEILTQAKLLQQVISVLRDAKNKNQIKQKDTWQLFIQSGNEAFYKNNETLLQRQLQASSLTYTNVPIPQAIAVTYEHDKFYIQTNKSIDTQAMKEALIKDLTHQKNFLEAVSKKLSNERFVQSAKPEVVALERKKQTDALARIRTIEEALQQL